jgi:hypothetical protein
MREGVRSGRVPLRLRRRGVLGVPFWPVWLVVEVRLSQGPPLASRLKSWWEG